MLSVRPKVAELIFQLYGRSLHPELFTIYSSRSIDDRELYKAEIHITGAGHFVTWRHEGITLTEVATTANTPLPKKRRLMYYPLKGECSDTVQCRGNIQYQVQFQLEPLEPEVFWTLQNELANSGQRNGMLHQFDNGRMELGALSYINVETRQRSMLIQAFHTFPDDYAVVKSQSLFEISESH